MELLWPAVLYLLGLIPVLIVAYIWILRRRKPFAVRYSSLSLIRAALPQQSHWRRHIPFALFLLAISSLIMAVSRPVSTVTVPASNATIILAIDVSRSMCSTDILPSRLEAAKAAALKFVENQDGNKQIGVVAFAGFAVLVQAPSRDQDLLETAIKNLTTARRTAIGEGILMSLDALSEIDDSITSPYSGIETVPLPAGEYAPAIIVLLTDGVSTTGTHPLLAAQLSVDRGVRVYTIGFGTDNNTSIPNCGFQSGDQFGGQFFGGGGGGGPRREIDEETLKQVAEMTGGSYHLAVSANELQDVFQNLPTQLMTVTETTEVSVMFVVIGALLVTLAIALSMIWHPIP
ncbi:MAG TPA: VWA domain-containing protein [Anaerolineales bacterium]|nr:VWA domain-containing protein [Anaerolineales bacterium]